MTRRIDLYEPAGHPAAWRRVGPEVRRIVAQADPPTAASAGEALSILTRLAVFADSQGMEAKARVRLSDACIERFVAIGCADLTEPSRANYRSKLRRLRDAVQGSGHPGGRPVPLSSSVAEMGQEKTVAALLERNPATHADPSSPLGVTDLLEELRRTGQKEAAAVWEHRILNAGQPRTLPSSLLPYGRKLDGSPAQPWSWDELGL